MKKTKDTPLTELKELSKFEALELLYFSQKKGKYPSVKFCNDESLPDCELVGVVLDATRPFLMLQGEGKERITANRCYVRK